MTKLLSFKNTSLMNLHAIYIIMLRQLRTLYSKSNKIISTFSHCTIDVKLLLIKSYCTSIYCGYMWSDYKKNTYSKL